MTPDTIVIDKRRARVLCRATGDNELMTVRGDEGTRIDAAPRELRRIPVLDDTAAAELPQRWPLDGLEPHP